MADFSALVRMLEARLKRQKEMMAQTEAELHAARALDSVPKKG